MGFNGYPQACNTTRLHDVNGGYIYTYNVSDADVFDSQGPALLRGIEWVFSWTESALAAGSSIVYDTFLTPIDLTTIDLLIRISDSKMSLYIVLSLLCDFFNILDIIKAPLLDN